MHHSRTPQRRSVTKMLSLAVLVVVAALALCTLAPAPVHADNMYASALTMQIEPREEQCFYEELTAGKLFRLEFEVVRGGLLDCKLRITDPSGSIVVEKMAYFNKEDDALNEAEGRISFNAGVSGVHAICFDNTMSRWTAKVVSFFVLNDAAVDPKANVAKLQDLGPTVDSVIKIADELDAIETLQHHMRVREQSHRDTTLTTNSRVQWLALLESLLVISLMVFQLHYIRRWFAQTDTRGRV